MPHQPDRQTPTERQWQSDVSHRWTAEQRTRRILVVDDDRSLQALLRILLINAGYAITTASDGGEALALVQQDDYDLILLDLEMPVMNGREFFQEIRRLGKETPVVVVSAYGAESGQRELGAQGAISKPFDPANVPRIVSRVLGT